MRSRHEQPPGLQHDVPLAPLTTLQLGGAARYLVEAADANTVRSSLAWARRRDLPVAVLGGGSNLVVSDAGFDGLVIRIGLKGIECRWTEDVVRVTAAAGESWDELVAPGGQP